MNLKPIIIQISGVAHSGKDTSADHLVMSFQNLGYKTIKIGIADRLKVICKELIKLFYNIDIPLTDFYDIEKKELIHDDYPQFAGVPFQLRKILQLIGTDIFRDLLWTNIWCDYLRLTYLTEPQYQIIIISDCRFQNEIDYFRSLETNNIISKLLTIRINRDTPSNLTDTCQNHISEKNMQSLTTNVIVQNNGTIQDLYNILYKQAITPIASWIQQKQLNSYFGIVNSPSTSPCFGMDQTHS